MQSGRAAQLKTTSLPVHRSRRSTPRRRLSMRIYVSGLGSPSSPSFYGCISSLGCHEALYTVFVLSAGSEEQPTSKKETAAVGKQLEQPSSGLQGQQQVAGSSGADDGSKATAAQDCTSGAAVQSSSGGSGQGPPPASKPSDSDASELGKRYIDVQDAGHKFRRGCVVPVGVTFGLATQPDVFYAVERIDSKVSVIVAALIVLYSLVYLSAQDASSALFKYDEFRKFCVDKWGIAMVREALRSAEKDCSTVMNFLQLLRFLQSVIEK